MAGRARIYAPSRPLAGEKLDQPGSSARPAAGAEGPRALRRAIGSHRRRGDRRLEGRPRALRAPLARPAELAWAGHRFRPARAPGVPRRSRLPPPGISSDCTCMPCSARSKGRHGRPHDESGRRRLRRASLRLHVEPRSTGDSPRSIVEQHARRGRPRPRPLQPGERMQSMMALSLAVDAEGPASQSAWRAVRACAPRRRRRRRHSTRGSKSGDGRRAPASTAGDVANAEPGVDEQALAGRDGRASGPARTAQHHYSAASA